MYQEALEIKKLPVNEGDRRDASLITGLGRSPGGQHSNHSSILAWRIPSTDTTEAT